MTWYTSESEVEAWRQRAISVLYDTPSLRARDGLERAIRFSYDRRHSADKRRFALCDALATLNEPDKEVQAWG